MDIFDTNSHLDRILNLEDALNCSGCLAPLVFRPQEWFEEHYPPNQPSEMPQDERKQGRQGNHKG